MFPSITSGLLVLVTCATVFGFDINRNDNLAVYWGQNSYGATHSDTAGSQQTISYYCQDNSIDMIPIAFLNVFFDTGGLPSINLANICNNVDDPVFSGTDLPNCQFLASSIQACQAKGKAVTLSLGGSTGAASFSSAAQASAFADTIWNLFLGGSSSTRPFGSVVLDGVDLDIEGGGTTYFDSFVNQIRAHASGASKKYYVTAAPQCPYPDAYLGTVLNAVAFDAVLVQFYNNYCGVSNYPSNWDFGSWDAWAKSSHNPNVKIFLGAPASSTAGGNYVPASTLGSIAQTTRSQYSSFGGVMLWDASQAYANGRYDAAIKAALAGGGSVSTVPTSSPSGPSSTSHTTTTSSNPSSGGCGGVAAWSSGTAYQGGAQVTYNGHLWTAKWWTQADTPGGSAGVWTDNGACSGLAAATVAAASSAAPSDARTTSSGTVDTATSAAANPSSSAGTAPATSAPAEASGAVSSAVSSDALASASASDAHSPATTGSPSKRSRFFRL